MSLVKINLLNQNSTTSAAKSSSPSTPKHSPPISFISRINLRFLWSSFKEWIRRPKHIALFIWLLFVASGFIILALLMSGILNRAIPSSSRRNNWSEITNQILNALFTIMSLYEHPKFFYQLFLLLRWRAGDEIELRRVYHKNGIPNSAERKHMIIVLLLLHITCFAQYVLCALYWFYTSTTRPRFVLTLSNIIGTAALIMVVFYRFYGFLDAANEEEEELKKSENFKQGLMIVNSPEWIGGLFDCRDETSVTCLSFFCTFCVFGWNMERLGLGNKYVHIITFTVLCISPFFVFAATSLHVNGGGMKLSLEIIGSLLCLFGLLYGGFWRTKMRKKFRLPGNPLWCISSSAVTDYIQWLFCWSCSLAQEVRTANFYDIEKDGFYQKVVSEGGWPMFIPLENGGRRSFLKDYEWSYGKDASVGLPVTVMEPPLPPMINVEGEEIFFTIEL